MKRKKIQSYLLLAFVVLFLSFLAYWAIEGSVQQWSHSNTFGQRLETIFQFICGFLTLITILTLFLWNKWASPVRITWGGSFVITAGLSSLVWGPPMPLVTLAFTSIAILIAWGLIRILNKVDKMTLV